MIAKKFGQNLKPSCLYKKCVVCQTCHIYFILLPQHISYDKLSEIQCVSWLVVEKIITYTADNNTADTVNFWATLKLVSDPDGVNEEITLVDTFERMKKVSVPFCQSNGYVDPHKLIKCPAQIQMCRSIKSITPRFHNKRSPFYALYDKYKI